MTETRWLDNEEMQVWRALLGVGTRVLSKLDDDLVAEYNLRVADYEVLVLLSEAPAGRLRMSELAGAVFLSPSGLTRRVDHLANGGLVVREQCPSDRRGSFAVLTAAGMRALEQAAPTHVEGVRRYVFDRMNRDELCVLANVLQAILQASDPMMAKHSDDGPLRTHHSSR